MEYAIWDDDGVKVAGEERTYAPTGSFEFAVPDENPSEDYEAWVWMTSEDGGYAEYSAWAYLVVDAYELMIWPGDSGYTSGEFAPGDTVTVHFSIGAYLTNHLPVYEMYIWTSYDPITMTIMVTEPEGTFEVQVPEDAPTAQMWIDVNLYDPVNDDYLSGDGTAVMVNNELRGWDKHKEVNGSIYTNYVNDGVTLLQKHCNASDRVLTMDHVNPFPYALKWRPPLGGVAAIAFNFTLSSQHRPSFDAFFGDATVVLLPKRPAQMRIFIDGFYALYKPALIERYQLYAESNWFCLYKRK